MDPYNVLYSVWAALVVLGLLVQIRPNIFQYDDILVITSGFRAKLYSLWCGGRRIVVDPKERTVKFYYRRLWCVTSSRRIAFDWIDRILFGANFLWCFNNVQRRERDSFMDMYQVYLKLKDGEIVTVYRFVGSYDEGQPLMLADLLSGMIGVPIDSPSD